MIGICTDSNAMLPADLVERYGIEVVPLTIVVDGKAVLESDLDPDEFFAVLSREPRPEVSTAAVSPGEFAMAYENLVSRGATEIISIHLDGTMSATCTAANLAAESSPVPVRVVDTGTASFAVGCCVWETAEALARGASAAGAAEIAKAVADQAWSVFVVGALDLARKGGRLAEGVDDGPDHDSIPVLTLAGGKMTAVGQAASTEEAVALMAEQVRAHGSNLRVGLTVADAGSEPLWRGLEAALVGTPEVADLVRYRMGPSVALHTGPGTAGAVYYPMGKR